MATPVLRGSSTRRVVRVPVGVPINLNWEKMVARVLKMGKVGKPKREVVVAEEICDNIPIVIAK